MTLEIDDLLKATTNKFLNISQTPVSWSQATLPIKFGGLGIRSTGDLALPAFLSSVHSSITLISGILNITNPTDVEVSCVADAEAARMAENPGESPPDEKASQAAWDLIKIKATHRSILENCHNPSDRARILAVSEPESGQWLHALPSRNIGTILDPSLRIHKIYQ